MRAMLRRFDIRPTATLRILMTVALAAAIATAFPARAATEVAATVAADNDTACSLCASALAGPGSARLEAVRLPPPARADRAARPVAVEAATVAKPAAGTASTVKTTKPVKAAKPVVKAAPAAKPAAKKAAAATTGAKRSTVRAPAAAPAAHGSVEAVVGFALAQVGKPYVWGASGPGSYDCSGLVAAAFARAGVSLPHQSDGIAGRGRAVSGSQLQRGDVILYSGHVAIALGGGMMVHAANPRTGIVVAKIYGSPIGYRRML